MTSGCHFLKNNCDIVFHFTLCHVFQNLIPKLKTVYTVYIAFVATSCTEGKDVRKRNRQRQITFCGD